MLEKSGFNLSGRQTVSRHVDNIIDTTANPVVAVVIATRAVTGELQEVNQFQSHGTGNKATSYVVALVHIQVGIQVTLVGAPHRAGHTGPRLLESQNTLDIVATNLLARDRVDDGGLNTEEGQGGATGLGRSHTTQGSDDVGSSFSLPVSLLAKG